jgi:hypothetical protein
MVRIADYPELSWKQILQVLENNGFVETQSRKNSQIVFTLHN